MPSYTNMKQEFEAYLHQIRTKLDFTILQLLPNQVGAYIIAIII